MRTVFALFGLCLFATPAQAQGARWFPAPGSYPYSYQAIQHVPGGDNEGYRLDYNLVADAQGGLVVVVLRAQHRAGGQWADATVDDTCRAALHAGKGELARVTLLPLAPEAVQGLGEPFLALCAPQDIFFPMLDLLNVALIQSPHFGIAALSTPGDSHRFAAFDNSFNRGNFTGNAVAPGGAIRWVSADGDRATVDWAPDPTTLKVIMRGAANGADMRMEGTQRKTLRVVIDRRSGALLGATAPFDSLNVIMDIKDVPPLPMTITRDVTIAPRRP